MRTEKMSSGIIKPWYLFVSILLGVSITGIVVLTWHSVVKSRRVEINNLAKEDTEQAKETKEKAKEVQIGKKVTVGTLDDKLRSLGFEFFMPEEISEYTTYIQPKGVDDYKYLSIMSEFTGNTKEVPVDSVTISREYKTIDKDMDSKQISDIISIMKFCNSSIDETDGTFLTKMNDVIAESRKKNDLVKKSFSGSGKDIAFYRIEASTQNYAEGELKYQSTTVRIVINTK